MRFATVALAASIIGGLSLAAQSPAVPSPSRDTRELTDLFPGDPKTDPYAVTADERRTYYTNNTGEAWLYDRTQKTKTRISTGPLWDLSLSRSGDALVYTKGGAHRGDQYVWTLTLDPATGVAKGAEHQLSAHQGDAPSISPDGKLVAFARDDASGVGQSVVVMPLGGGAERVVAATLPSSVANIRWMPDGKTLYFGVNPPVACVPEWSCLPLTQDLRQPPGTIRRVAASGGAVTTVATGRGLLPGLSPDGTTLMYLDTGTVRRFVIANADGTRRDTLTLPPTETPTGWLRGSTVVLASSGNLRRLRTMSIADAQSQVLMDGADALFEPSWSPDGRLMTTAVRGPQHGELRLQNADGSAPRTLPLPETVAGSTAWSPDQKWIAYTGFADSPPLHIAVVEVATGRTQKLYEYSTDESVAIRWLADSKGLILTDTFQRPPTSRRVIFKTVDLAGKVTTLRELPLGPPPSGAVAIDETTALVMQNTQAGYRVVRLNGDTTERELPIRSADASPVSLSSDAQWVMTRRTPTPAAGAAASVLDVARVDGSVHWTIPLPFVAASGAPRIVPGTDSLIVFEARRPDGDPGVYLVSGGTNSVRKLFTYSSQYGTPELTVSPDGRRLLYLVWEAVPPQLLTMDLAAPARAR